jgi:hypothetical protein
MLHRPKDEKNARSIDDPVKIFILLEGVKR